MITILPFKRLTAPQVFEGGADISLKPSGKWFFEVRRSDGTTRLPFGDNWIPNVFLNAFKEKCHQSGLGGIYHYDSGSGAYSDFLCLFFDGPSTGTAEIRVGTDGTAAAASQTGIIGTSYTDAGFMLTGNSATMSSSTGDIVTTTRKYFTTETGPKTYREAVIYVKGVGTTAGVAGLGTTGMAINRIAFPGPIELVSGDQLIITVAVTTPTIAATAQTVTLAAQNGVNISGQLKLMGTTQLILGGTVSAAGVYTPVDPYHAALFPSSERGGWYLSTSSAFAAWNTATSALAAVAATTNAWGTYTNGTYYRDFIGSWAPSGSDTPFQSITLIPHNSGVGGYQLLMDNSMTKAAASTLTFGLRFSLS